MGDGIRRIVRALYDRAGGDEKKEAEDLFRKLDLKGEGKIREREFIKKGVESSEKGMFKELDWNRDGWLDFDDVLALFYYRKKAITILRCRGCRELIFGPSFCCFQCFFNTPDRRYALCCDCYGGGKFQHHHRLSSTSATVTADLLHDQDLLLKLSKLIHDNPKALHKRGDMERLWETAKSDNGGASAEVEAMADNFLKSMGDNRLDLQHFSTLMIERESAVDKFLKPRPDSDFATNYVKNKMKSVLAQSNNIRTSAPLPPRPTMAAAVATVTAPDTHYVEIPTHRPNREASSKELVVGPSSVLKVATATFKIVDMALTIASLSSMCTIM